MSTSSPTRSRLARLALLLAGGWILVGALFKLLWGTPNDLPEVVRDLPLDLGLTYRLAIGIELCVAAGALLRPRLAWPAVVALYGAFGAVLTTQILADEGSCGCLGSEVSLTPVQMASIDGVLLLGVLLSAPWSARMKGLHSAVLGTACAVLFALPWMLDREVSSPEELAAAIARARPAGAEADGSASETPTEAPGGTPSKRPSKSKTYAVLDIEEWVDQSIYDTPLATAIGDAIYELPPDGLWVLWRWTCSACAEHLADLAVDPGDHSFLVLVRLREEHDTDDNGAVLIQPEGGHVFHAELPDTVVYSLTTPGELVLEGGVIVEATEGAGSHDHD